jgi:hypothetical protein
MIVITVRSGDWGSGSPEPILAVPLSATREIETFIPLDDPFPTVLVSKSTEGFPRTLSERGPGGEIQVTLSAKDHLWSKFAYQFGHELCHIFCNSAVAEYNHSNFWFEEVLCEVSSWFVPGRMAHTWQTRPPYDGGANYAPWLQDYRDQYLSKAKLADGTIFIDFFAQHEESLRADFKQPELIRTIAQVLPFSKPHLSAGRLFRLSAKPDVRSDRSRSTLRIGLRPARASIGAFRPWSRKSLACHSDRILSERRRLRLVAPQLPFAASA